MKQPELTHGFGLKPSVLLARQINGEKRKVQSILVPCFALEQYDFNRTAMLTEKWN